MFPLNATVYCRFVCMLNDLLQANMTWIDCVLHARKLLTGLGAV